MQQTVAGDQVLRREWAEARLQDIKRNGRSELDIVGEGLELVLRVVRELEKGAWPRVVNNAVVSGEVRQTLVGLAGLLKDQTPTAEEDQIGPILGSGSPAQDAAPPELQQDHGSSEVNRSARESEEPEKPDAGTAE